MTKRGWEAIYGAMFVPELVECDMRGACETEQLATARGGLQERELATRGGFESFPLVQSTNPTDTIMQVIHNLREVQANG